MAVHIISDDLRRNINLFWDNSPFPVMLLPTRNAQFLTATRQLRQQGMMLALCARFILGSTYG
jgi:hypothetical protein